MDELHHDSMLQAVCPTADTRDPAPVCGSVNKVPSPVGSLGSRANRHGFESTFERLTTRCQLISHCTVPPDLDAAPHREYMNATGFARPRQRFQGIRKRPRDLARDDQAKQFSQARLTKS